MKKMSLRRNLWIAAIMLALSIPIAAQTCTSTVTNSFFLDATGKVSEVRPGDKVYQFRLVGNHPTDFELVPESFMKNIGTIYPMAGDTTSALWTMSFNANMGRTFNNVRLKNKCDGSVKVFKLESKMTLLNQ